MLRKRLDKGSYDEVISLTEWLSSWLKWNRFGMAGVSGRGARVLGIQSASREFGMPVLETRFVVRAVLAGPHATPYPDQVVVSGFSQLRLQFSDE